MSNHQADRHCDSALGIYLCHHFAVKSQRWRLCFNSHLANQIAFRVTTQNEPAVYLCLKKKNIHISLHGLE